MCPWQRGRKGWLDSKAGGRGREKLCLTGLYDGWFDGFAVLLEDGR
jgi:hypothetical protein